MKTKHTPEWELSIENMRLTIIDRNAPESYKEVCVIHCDFCMDQEMNKKIKTKPGYKLQLSRGHLIAAGPEMRRLLNISLVALRCPESIDRHGLAGDIELFLATLEATDGET